MVSRKSYEHWPGQSLDLNFIKNLQGAKLRNKGRKIRQPAKIIAYRKRQIVKNTCRDMQTIRGYGHVITYLCG